MFWLNFKLCLIAVTLVVPPFVLSEEKFNSNIKEEVLLPLEQIINPVKDESKVSDQPDKQDLRPPSVIRNFSRVIDSNTGFQLTPGRMPAALRDQSQDVEAASASNKVLLVLNNDKNKSADESLKRLARNPDIMDEIVGHFQQLGGDMTQQVLQHVSQTVPDISRTFGQALNEALTQTNLLAQVAPGSLDLGQLGQSLSQSFFAGAVPNILNPLSGQSEPTDLTSRAAGDTSAQTVGAVGPEAAPMSADGEAANATANTQNPFDQLLGNPLFPHLPLLPKLNLAPFGMLGPLYAFSPLLPLGSEISEVRVLPEENSPYTITPQYADAQTMAEAKLKAALKESLRRKTIPVLWFHQPEDHNLQLTKDDVETKAKLKLFEQKVVDELKLLQDISRIANELKTAQLQSGVPPTTSLTTKLNLYEIPIYDITLGDVEKTWNDEHVKLLLQTITKQNNQEFRRQQQATTKYLTDLTGTPIKRQTKVDEDTLNNMEKDDIMKMMSYAYRMAALNGHEMPWLKAQASHDKGISKTKIAKQQEHFGDVNMRMDSERQWLEEKEQRMLYETEKQRQMLHAQEQSQWMPPQIPEQMQMMHPQMRYDTMEQGQIMPPQMPEQRQIFNPQMPEQRQMMSPQMPEQREFMYPQMPEQSQTFTPQMPEQRQMISPQSQQYMSEQRQMAEQWQIMIPQQIPIPKQEQNQQLQIQLIESEKLEQPQTFEQKPWLLAETPENTFAQNHGQFQLQIPITAPEMPQMPGHIQIMPPQMHPQIPMQHEQIHMQLMKSENPDHLENLNQTPWAVAETPENTSAQNRDMNNTPLVGTAKPQMAENEAKARGLENLFGNVDIFGLGKNKPAALTSPTINNYYCRGCTRYPPMYGPSSAAHRPYIHAGGVYPNRYPLPPQLQKPILGYYGGGGQGSNAYGSLYKYRSATGDEEIAAMLQQEQLSPKIMMVIPMLSSNAETMLTTQPRSNKGSAEDLTKNQAKRLAKRNIKSRNKTPFAYLIVLRNSDNNKKSRSRRKRSTEYASLQPIDESSLSMLRKTYKNSLREITLKPNETPAEALMRYNADSVKEALDKVNEQPVEISTGTEAQEVNENLNLRTDVKEEEQNLAELSQNYGHGQFVSVLNEPGTILSNGRPYINLPDTAEHRQPSYVPFNQQQEAVYGPDSGNQEGIYNNLVSKYNAPGVFSNDRPNPPLSMYDAFETVPYNIEHYSPAIDEADKGIIYQKADDPPKFIYNDFLIPTTITSPQATYKKFPPFAATAGQYLKDNDSRKILNYENSDSKVINQSYDREADTIQPQVQLNKCQRSAGVEESPSLENIMDFIQEQLVQCCNKCKDNILKLLEETFKQKNYGSFSSLMDTPHILTYRKPAKHEDHEYEQWLIKMSEKGYNADFLTKQHQRDYLKDDKLNLYIGDKQDPGHEIDQIFNKNNQSYKRDTNTPETKLVNEKEQKREKTRAAVNNKIEKLDEYGEDKIPTDDIEESKPGQQISEQNQSGIKVESQENKHNIKDDINRKEQTHSLNTATETTTQSAYALRGKFRQHKANPRPFSLIQGKRVDNYKNINKLDGGLRKGKANIEDRFSDKEEKLEEILDVLHDLSQRSKERIKEISVDDNSKAMASESTSTNATARITTNKTNEK